MRCENELPRSSLERVAGILSLLQLELDLTGLDDLRGTHGLDREFLLLAEAKTRYTGHVLALCKQEFAIELFLGSDKASETHTLEQFDHYLIVLHIHGRRREAQSK